MTGDSGPLHGLGPAARACLIAGLTAEPPEVPEPASFERESTTIIQEGLAPVALKLAGADGGLDPETFARFRQVTLESQIRAMAAGHAAGDALRRFDEAGIPVVVIKGPAIERFHPAGWPRTYSDIDLLVAPRDFHAVVEVCVQAGFVDAVSRPPWPWFDLRCKEGVNIRGPVGGNLDIHHHVPPWVFGANLSIDQVLTTATWSSVGGAPVRLVSASNSLVIASLHVLNDLWKGRIGLSSWRDILALLRHLGPAGAEEAFDAVGIGWLLGLVAGELASSVPEAEIVVPRHHHRVPVSARMRIAVLGWNNDSSISSLRASWIARLPAPQVVAFLAGCAVPQRTFVQESYGTYRAYWHSLVDEARSTMKGADYRGAKGWEQGWREGA